MGDFTRLLQKLAEDWPGKEVVTVSTRTGEGVAELFAMLLAGESVRRPAMEVDYAVYGAGEAELGWYNARLTLLPGSGVDLRSTRRKKAGGPEVHATVDGNVFLLELAQAVQADLEKAGMEIGHFKMSLRGDKAGRKAGSSLAVVQAVRNGAPAELSQRMTGRVEEGELLINLRAEGAPAKLERIVARHLKGLPVRWEGKAAFRPGQPKPTHRITTA